MKGCATLRWSTLSSFVLFYLESSERYNPSPLLGAFGTAPSFPFQFRFPACVYVSYEKRMMSVIFSVPVCGPSKEIWCVSLTTHGGSLTSWHHESLSRIASARRKYTFFRFSSPEIAIACTATLTTETRLGSRNQPLSTRSRTNCTLLSSSARTPAGVQKSCARLEW